MCVRCLFMKWNFAKNAPCEADALHNLPHHSATHCTEPKGSLQCPQEQTCRPCPTPGDSHPHPYVWKELCNKNHLYGVTPIYVTWKWSSFTNKCTFIKISKGFKIYIKIHTEFAATCFGLRPSSGCLRWSLAKVIFMLKFSKKLHHYVHPDDDRSPKHVGAN
jgi:hypothetical protein